MDVVSVGRERKKKCHVVTINVKQTLWHWLLPLPVSGGDDLQVKVIGCLWKWQIIGRKRLLNRWGEADFGKWWVNYCRLNYLSHKVNWFKLSKPSGRSRIIEMCKLSTYGSIDWKHDWKYTRTRFKTLKNKMVRFSAVECSFDDNV